MRIRLIATTTFGLEAVAKREIADLGYEIEKVEDGKITYIADERGIVRSNLWLRTPDRILLKTDEFKALEFKGKGIPVGRIDSIRWRVYSDRGVRKIKAVKRTCLSKRGKKSNSRKVEGYV